MGFDGMDSGQIVAQVVEGKVTSILVHTHAERLHDAPSVDTQSLITTSTYADSPVNDAIWPV